MPSRKKRPARKRGTSRPTGDLSLTIQDMAHGGSGISRHKGRMIFVPYVIPGEKLTARVVRSTQKVDFAEGVELKQASADRVQPQCTHFGAGRCWGCQWQHIAYDPQLALKYDVLADQLSRLGKFDDRTLEHALQDVKPSPSQWGYNYHALLTRADDGQLGFSRMDGSIEGISECLVMHPDLFTFYESLDIDFADLKRLRLLLGSDGATMIVLEMTSEDAPELGADFPTSANLLLPDNEPVNLVGDAHTIYSVGGRDFRVTAGAEFRPNVAQVDQNLIPAVLKACDLNGYETVLDLYAGVGVYSAFIAPRASLVTLVESYPPAATDADENLAAFENVDVVEGAVEDVLPALIEAEERYDIAIVDPPGRGLSKDALAALVELGVSRIVYVSSDPASLARDSQQLSRKGYHLQSVQPLDFAPQTYYVESVVCFERG